MTIIIRRVAAMLLACCAMFSLSAAQDLPRAPCEAAPLPAYADPGAPPRTRVWHPGTLEHWTPQSCTGWPVMGGAGNGHMIASLAGSFLHSGNAAHLLPRFGAISGLRGMRYWSVGDRNWRTLITDATAISGTDPQVRRDDFTAAELKPGVDRYFVQTDSRSSGEVVYRMRIRELREDRIVVETENVSPVRVLLFTLFAPRELRAVYFIERLRAGVWGYYSLTAAGARSASGNERSLLNRAAAFFRHFTGVPTDGEPPLAP